VAFPAPQYFSTLSHQCTIFGGGGEVIEYKMCVLSLSTIFSETFFILRRNERDVIINTWWSSCEVSFILVTFWWNSNFLDRFSKNTHIRNFMKILPVGAELFNADGQTDLTRLTVAFRSFVNAPKEDKREFNKWGYSNLTLIQKGKAIPLQAWTGSEGSRKLRLPYFKTFSTRRW
jgi:hypothetical protein